MANTNDPMGMGADAMNAAVARIGRISKQIFEDKSAKAQVSEVSDRPDPGPDHKSFAPRGDNNSLAQKVPSHEMPPKKAAMEQPGTDGYDDEEDEVAKPEQGAKKESIMNGIVKATGLSGMSEWRMLAGLTPMYESAERGTGDVPTAGVNKQNKSKAGLPGLEGQAVQDIDPKEYGDDGADSEDTFDAAPGDLKKESYNHFFGQFLEERGLNLDVFNQLVDEAMESNDIEEMNALIQVEGIFGKWMEKKKKTTPQTNNELALLQRTKSAMQAKKAGKIDPTYGRPVKKAAAEEEYTFEADDDGSGNPDWKKAFAHMKRGR